MNAAQPPREQPEVRGNIQSGARFWMLFPAVLLGVSVSGWLWMVSMAVNDPGFSVESDYYKKGANFDEEMARRANNQRLAWKVSAVDARSEAGHTGRIALVVRDGSGRPLDGLKLKAEAFSVARGGDLRQLEFIPLGEGRYEAQLEQVRPGLWTVRLSAQQEETSFTHELRVEFFNTEDPPS